MLKCINKRFERYWKKNYVFPPYKNQDKTDLIQKACIILRKYKKFLDEYYNPEGKYERIFLFPLFYYPKTKKPIVIK